MGKPHVLAVPLPAQGHVIPMMEVCQCLADKGIRVTFVNTEFIHGRFIKALSQTGNVHELIDFVSVPDGLESWEDRHNQAKLAQVTIKVMPRELESLIESINRTQREGISCIVTDFYMGASLQVAEKFRLKTAALMPASIAMLALTISAQKLVDEGIINKNGTPVDDRMIQLAPSMPKMRTATLPWASLPDLETQTRIFHCVVENNELINVAEKLICNSSYALESEAGAFVPDCLPIGPLIASSRSGKSLGSFWHEDSTCLEWLDQQGFNSVIYIAFGSFTIFDAVQFQELALGLELANRPFLWVVRDDITSDIDEAYPTGFKERVKNRGKIVDWAPQQQVLSHPSVACFLSHCGWNSTVESASNAVPILCWPYFADQFINQTYIVDHWEVGLALNKDDSGIVRREEIKNKVERVVDDKGYKTRASKLQARAMAGVEEAGDSHKNFHDLVDWIKET